MTLDIGLQTYEPRWDLALQRCVDLDNGELKKKFGANLKIQCCGTVFLQRPGALQHFKSKKHLTQCLDPYTKKYENEIPQDVSPNELLDIKLKEVRQHKVDYSNLDSLYREKCKECDNKDEQIKDQFNIITTLREQRQKYNHKKKKNFKIVGEPPNLIDLL